MHDRPAEAVQHRAEVVERACHIDVGDINVPMLVRRRWLIEVGPLFGGLPVPLAQ